MVKQETLSPVFLDISSVGTGGGMLKSSATTEIGKNVVEIWNYLQEVYIFGKEAEIKEIFSKQF